MKVHTQESEDLQKIADLVADIGVGMMTMQDNATGELHSRPMMPLEIDDELAVLFFTRESSLYGYALDRVNLAFADPDHASYVSIVGRAEVIKDVAAITRLWTPMAKPWFQEGVGDPGLVVLRVKLDSAEYWDANSSRVIRAFAMATSVLAGEPIGLGVHKRVKTTPSWRHRSLTNRLA